MGRRKDPNALTNAQHQRTHVALYKLVTIKITPQVAEVLRAARTRTKLSTNPVLMAAFKALLAAEEDASRAVAGLPPGSHSMGQPARTSRSPKPQPQQRDFFEQTDGQAPAADTQDSRTAVPLPIKA